MLSKHAFEEYKEIHREVTGEVLSDDVLFNEATNLLTLLDRVYRPIKKVWLQEYGQRNKTKRGVAENSQSKRKIAQTSGEVRRIQEPTPRTDQK